MGRAVGLPPGATVRVNLFSATGAVAPVRHETTQGAAR
jgi:hypothetical protein